MPRSKFPNAIDSPDDVYCIVRDSKGHLWFGSTGGGVCRYDGKSFNRAFRPRSGGSRKVNRAPAGPDRAGLWEHHYFGERFMAKKKAASKGQNIHDPSPEGLEAAQATAAGLEFFWHTGRMTGLGVYGEGGRGVTVTWDEGGATSHVGDISDDQWEVFKLAFAAGGRIAILSDVEGWEWMYDYRYVEALR